MRAVRFLSLLLTLPLSSLAQAWLTPQGDGTVSVLYQDDISRLHSFDDGRTKDRGHTSSQGLYVNADFSLTDRLAVQVGLPYIDAKYEGPFPHLLVRGKANTAVAVDNGSYHGGFQDFRFNLRYALTRRALKEEVAAGDALSSPAAVRDFLRLTLAALPHEAFMVLFLDSQHRLLAAHELFRGTLAQTSVYPREVVKAALARNAAAVIFAHNHPSGVAEPSRADELLTAALKQALALVDIRTLDHFIVAGHRVVSFAERGIL